MAENDPDFPEQFRAETPGASLQRLSNSFSLEGSDSDDQGQVQPMSDDDPDWADQMQRDSAERLATQQNQGKHKLNFSLFILRGRWYSGRVSVLHAEGHGSNPSKTANSSKKFIINTVKTKAHSEIKIKLEEPSTTQFFKFWLIIGLL